ncbi:NERD domain-containing protein [Aquimarina sp. W85]|uniref:NERD domain-containing protein n=1 Tax=Aquimarina rhodophyticola TaxID=3342246 RepID=UPI0036706E74
MIKLETESLLILYLIILNAIGVLIYKAFYPRIKGILGEYGVAWRLRRLNRDRYKTINDIYLNVNNRSTQIDHIVVSVYGIFVIETKNYNGWIHGNEHSEYWKQTFYKKKQRFRNPIKQNLGHIYFLKKALSEFNQVQYHSIIVFVGKGKLKNVYTNTPVIYRSKLLRTIKKYTTPNLSIEQVEKIVSRLEEAAIKKKGVSRNHKNYVRKHLITRKKRKKALRCPSCNNKLVVRKGKYGKFYGCTNFPKCRFTMKKKSFFN